jgi:acetoin:2,6-dichlorophenolindophenol oxidoreductase subunit alpha
MMERGVAKEDLEGVWAKVRADIDEAIAFADASPVPTADQLTADVYTVMAS